MRSSRRRSRDQELWPRDPSYYQHSSKENPAGTVECHFKNIAEVNGRGNGDIIKWLKVWWLTGDTQTTLQCLPEAARNFIHRANHTLVAEIRATKYPVPGRAVAAKEGKIEL